MEGGGAWAWVGEWVGSVAVSIQNSGRDPRRYPGHRQTLCAHSYALDKLFRCTATVVLVTRKHLTPSRLFSFVAAERQQACFTPTRNT